MLGGYAACVRHGRGPQRRINPQQVPEVGNLCQRRAR